MFGSSRRQRLWAELDSVNLVLDDLFNDIESLQATLREQGVAVAKLVSVVNTYRMMHSLAAESLAVHASDLATLFDAVANLEAVVFEAKKPTPVKKAAAPTSKPATAPVRNAKATKPVAAPARTKKA